MDTLKKVLITVLVASILGLLAITGYLIYRTWKDNQAGNRSMLIVQELNEIIIAEQIPSNTDDSAEPVSPMMQLYGENYMGLIRIPSLSLELPINMELTDSNLESSPCLYLGDLASTLIVSAHNYKNHFGKIGTLLKGDLVVIKDMRGNEHQYTIDIIEQLHESDVESMVNNPFDLTLFTCTPDNKDRIAVRGSKVPVVHYVSAGNGSDPSDTEGAASTKPDTPAYRIDYSKETIRLGQGDRYSKNNGETYTEIKQSGYTYLDVSDFITAGIPIYIKKGAANKDSQSDVQVVTPAPRATLDSVTLAPENGKLTLDNQYEVFDTERWRGLPRITSDEKFNIRIKSTAQMVEGNMTGYAASLPGTLIIKYGEFEPGKKGVVSAEVVGS